MSIERRLAKTNDFSQLNNLEDLLALGRSGILASSKVKGRRALKRAARSKVAKAGLIAPLLAAEGCLSLGKKDVPLAEDTGASGGGAGGSNNGSTGSPGINAGGGGGKSAPVDLEAMDDHFHTEAGAPVNIAASQLQANDIHSNTGPLELVRVFDAVNGTVFFDGAIVQFIPDEGFEGTASFKYEVRDSNGGVSQAIVEIGVGEGGMDHGGGHGDGHGDGDGSHVHPDDPSKVSEHMAVLELVPVSEATHIAVNDGSWFDPNTWAGGEVPGEGAKVVIPHGMTVTYDDESAVSLFTVRVDGALTFATDQDTFMEVDTFVVTPSGKLTIGTIGNPVSAGVETVIQIADNGPIDVGWDPMLLSRGVISHGEVEIHGAEKDAFLKVAGEAMKGDTSLTLEELPEGWQVGDRLVLTGTHLEEVPWAPAGAQQPDVGTEDEELIITAIDGTTIHFDRALIYDHDVPRADLNAYVANYSRNIRIITENADDLPVHQRGHVMLMHSDDIDVRYAEFTDLGRTDKSERAFDVGDLDATKSDSNVKGRYSLHIHRAGFEDFDDPAMLVGNAVWGSPGWGVVHHDSNAILEDNAAYDVFGAAFVAETGNETGRWVHNIAIKSIGVRGSGYTSNPKVGDDVNAFDLGRTGAGFWFQGREVDAVDNVAAGVPAGHAFVYFHRAPKADFINVLSENANMPESLSYNEEVSINMPAISQFTGNEALASGSGFMVVKAGANQNHDVHSEITDFTAWEVRYGINLHYTGHYLVKDVDLIGAESLADNGIKTGPNTFDVSVVNARVHGFDTGVYLEKVLPAGGSQDNFGYLFLDVDISGAVNDYHNLDGFDRVLTQADLTPGQLSFDYDAGQLSEYKFTKDGQYRIEYSGTKTDSAGVYENVFDDDYRYTWANVGAAANEEGYWTTADGEIVVSFEQYYTDRISGDVLKQALFVTIPGGLNVLAKNGAENPRYNGVLDLDSQAPVTANESVTVDSGHSVTIDVLANDFDPDGDQINVDGFIDPTHGRVTLNDDGTVTYTADVNYTGSDHLSYWVEDNQGNFTIGEVFVTVEA